MPLSTPTRSTGVKQSRTGKCPYCTPKQGPRPVVYLGYNLEQQVAVYRCQRESCRAKFFVNIDMLPDRNRR
jgi:hypothetical protein